MTMFLAVTAFVILVGFAVYTIWADHPAVLLRRRMRQAVQREDAAHRELDQAHTEAQETMNRVARRWNQQ